VSDQQDAEVRCPQCGTQRFVRVNTARRIRRGQMSGLCTVCRYGPKVVPTSELRAWWLTEVAGLSDLEARRVLAGSEPVPDVLLGLARGLSLWWSDEEVAA